MQKWKFIVPVYLWIFVAVVFAENPVTTVILARHAEKAKTPADNPVLTEKGQSRSNDLIRILGESGIKAIYTSEFARTKLTAEPLSKHLSIPIVQIEANKTPALVEEIRSKHSGEVVLIVGHSNTVPEIIQALGGPSMEEIDETQFDNLFVLTLCGDGKAGLLKMKYGSL